MAVAGDRVGDLPPVPELDTGDFRTWPHDGHVAQSMHPASGYADEKIREEPQAVASEA